MVIHNIHWISMGGVSMKNISTRFLSLFLAIALFLSFSGTSYAATQDGNFLTESQILDKIEEEKATVFNEVHRQLEAQNMTHHMNSYIEILSPQIECSVRMKYDNSFGSDEIMANGAYIPYGGTVRYTKSGTKFLQTYLDYDNTYYYVLSGSICVVKTVIETILGALPNWGSVFTALSAMSTICDSISKYTVREAGGYGHITSMQMSDGSKSTVLLGWNNYPYAYGVSNASSTVITSAFPRYDPFD